MAHKKGGGSSTNGRDSNAQRLGVKAFAGELVTGGPFCAPARNQIKPGVNVGIGSDDTLFAKVTGRVKFTVAELAGASLQSNLRQRNNSRSSHRCKKATATAAAFFVSLASILWILF